VHKELKSFKEKNSLDFQGAVIPKVVLKRDDEMGFDQFLKKIFF